MKTPQVHVIISPHFDDGIFSCGATAYQLAVAQHSVIIMTIMGGLHQGPLPQTPILADLHRRWQAGEDPLRQRKTEDERATQSLGLECMHVPLPDCVYRLAGGLPLYPSEESLFGAVHPADYAPRLLDGIQTPELETATHVYLPLGVGNHVDHQIVRAWGMTQARQIPNRASLRFYAEFPYSNAERATKQALDGLNFRLEPVPNPVSEAAMRAKIDAIACYESQLSTFWANHQDLEDDVRRAFRDPASGGSVEWFWRCKAAP